MIHLPVFVAAFTIATIAGADAQRPLVFGTLASRIRDQELQGVLNAVAESSAPVALYAHGSQTLPWTWYVNVFLKPTPKQRSVGLIRGRVVHLKCVPESEDAGCSEWKTTNAPESTYAMLSTRPSAEGAALTKPSDGGRPFEIVGQFSDEELLTLVAYVRTRPSPRSHQGWIQMGLSANLPVLIIRKNDDGTVDVVLSETGNPGETGRIARTAHGWEIIEAYSWIG